MSTPMDSSRLWRDALDAVKTGTIRHGELPTSPAPAMHDDVAFVRDLAHEIANAPDPACYLNDVPLPLVYHPTTGWNFSDARHYQQQLAARYRRYCETDPWLRDYLWRIPRQLIDVTIFAQVPAHFLTVPLDDIIAQTWPTLCHVLHICRADVDSLMVSRIANGQQHTGALAVRIAVTPEVQ